MLVARVLLEDLFPRGEIAPFEGEIDQQRQVFGRCILPSETQRTVINEELNHPSVPFRWPFALPSPQFIERVIWTTYAQ